MKPFVLSLVLAAATLSPCLHASQGALLANAGFEVEDPAGQASNWWSYGFGGRAAWAARSGAAGYAFYAAGNAYGGFGQDVAMSLTNGDSVLFSIYAKAEANYTNPNTRVGIEFWSGASLSYAVTNNVYATLAANRDAWVLVRIGHTNTVGGIDRIIVRCDYADGLIPAGASLATCQWDDGSITRRRIGGLAKFEPVAGVYLGALLENGGSGAELAEVDDKAGKDHAVFAKFVVLKTDPFPWDWVNAVTTACPGAALHLVLEPVVGFEDTFAPSWGPGQATYDAAVDFLTNCAATRLPVFLRFGHEANGWWYTWHPDYLTNDTVTPATYIQGWQNVAALAHAIAPNVAMVWAPNQGNGPEVLGDYERVYPGDEYVDWVGLSVYNGDWYGNGNEVQDVQFKKAIESGYNQDDGNPDNDTKVNFYWTFSDPGNPDGHHKPMMIAETSAQFVPAYSVTNRVQIAGFETLDGPTFQPRRVLAAFSNVNWDAWAGAPRVAEDDFESLAAWDWGPWGTNGYAWSNTADAWSGTNALVMSGAPEAGGVYVGGNGRSLPPAAFTVGLTLAGFQDLNHDAWAGTNNVTVDGFESLAAWNWGLWGTNGYTWQNLTNRVQGTNALCMSGGPEAGGTYVGGSGRDWTQGGFQTVKVIAEFQDLNSDGLALTNSLLVDTFENISVWNWGPWGNLFWSNTADRVQGTNALLMGGSPNPGEASVGGNGRTYDPDWSMNNGMQIWVKCDSSTRPYPIVTLGLRSANPPGTATVSRVITSESYGPLKIFFSNMTASAGFNWSNIWDFTLELLTTEPGSRPRDVKVDAWSRGTVTNSAGRDQDWWPGGTNCEPWADPGETQTWVVVSDPYLSYPENALRISGTDTNNNNYTGGNGCSLRPEDVNWSGGEAFAVLLRRGSGPAPNPSLRLELVDGASRIASHVIEVSWTNYTSVALPYTAMTVDSGFQWTNVQSVKLGMLTAVAGQAPGNLYLKRLEFGHLPAWPSQDWSPYDGMEIWARRSTGAEPDPTLIISVLSPGATASLVRTVTTTNYEPLRVYRRDWTAAGPFAWSNVIALKLEMLTTVDGTTPGSLYLDNWRLVMLDPGDQDWWPGGTNCTPWAEDGDPNAVHAWELVQDPAAGLPTNSLKMTGVDGNTNGYIGGNGCTIVGPEGAWGAWDALRITARRAPGSAASPKVAWEFIDSSARAAAGNAQVTSTNYADVVMSFAWMSVDDGFDWDHIQTVKLGMMTTSNGAATADLFVKRLQVGTVQYDVPRDWTPYHAIELMAKRAGGAEPDPVLVVGMISPDGNAGAPARVTNTVYEPVRIYFSDCGPTPGFNWAQIESLKLEMMSTVGDTRPADLYVDSWRLVTLQLGDQDWWPGGSSMVPWSDASDPNGGTSVWELVSDPAAGYASNSLRIWGTDRNTNYYIGGNGFSAIGPDRDWSGVTHLGLTLRRDGDTGKVDPQIQVTLVDGAARTSIAYQVVYSTNYLAHGVALDSMRTDVGFNWSNIANVVLDLTTTTAGSDPGAVYLKRMELGTVTNRYEQRWWKPGEPLSPVGNVTWTQTTDAAAGSYALEMSGPDANTNWWIGHNGCGVNADQVNWTNSNALVFHAKKRVEGERPDPKLEIVLDSDWVSDNGNEARVMVRIGMADWTEVIVPFDDFTGGPSFAWDNVQVMKLAFYTAVGGQEPHPLCLDSLGRVTVIVTNGADNARWKRDWMDQLFSLEDGTSPSGADYVSILGHFQNLHMINWFHVKKFEDGQTKDFKILEDGGLPAHSSYYARVSSDYFLSRVAVDSDEDGLSDEWETTYFSSPTGGDGMSDDDDDDADNWSEYIAGTNPTNENSALLMGYREAGDTNAGYVVRWESAPWRLYSLERTSNLVSGFTVLQSAIQATPPLNVYTDSAAGASGPVFYRVRVMP